MPAELDALKRLQAEPEDRKMYASVYREPVMVQRYLPEVRQGDKRIILVEGEPVGAVNRVPPEGEARAKLLIAFLEMGGFAQPTDAPPQKAH